MNNLVQISTVLICLAQCEVSTLKLAMAFFFQVLFYSIIFAIVSYNNICSLKIVLK
jgi:hypothetical protein